MGLFSFIGVAVTSATVVIYGETIWDPVVLITRFKSPALLVIALLSLCMATLATNIAANVVSPANDFANLWPRRSRSAPAATSPASIGILIQPWSLIADPTGYIFTWLVGYSALLGAIGGVLICDYYLIRTTRSTLVELYQREGPYWYAGGWNPRRWSRSRPGSCPTCPASSATVQADRGRPRCWMTLYSYAWFVGFGISFAVYAALMRMGTTAGPAPALRAVG